MNKHIIASLLLLLAITMPLRAEEDIRPRAAKDTAETTAEAEPTTLAPAEKTPSSNSLQKLHSPSESETLTKSESFSNGCQPLLTEQVPVPKQKGALASQLGPNFQVVRRGSFLIAGDMDKKSFSQLVDGVFACCRSCLQHDYFPRRPTETVTVYVFKDSASYRSGLRKHFGMAPISPYGHYGHRKRYIVINYETGPGTLVHELTHALMATDFPQAPIWISEGIASLYEQCRVEGDSLKGESNWRLPELQKSLSEKRLTPLRTLMQMSFRTFRAKKESLHYAQSRYFCKFAEEKGLLRKIYTEFREQQETDPTGIKSIERAFGKSLEEIEADWHTWIRSQEWK